MNKIVKTSLIIILVLIALLITLFFLPRILGLITNDISNVDENGLQIKRQITSNSENAFFDLERSAQKINFPKEKTVSINKYLSGESWDKQIIDDILSNNTESLLYFSDASEKSTIEDPALNDLSKVNEYTVMPNLNKWRDVSIISSLKALSLSQNGLHKEAVEESFKSIRVGQLIMDSPQYLITHLVGHAIKNKGLDSLEKTLENYDFSDLDLKKYSIELNNLRDTGEGLKNVFIVEYNMHNNSLDLVMNGSMKNDIDNSDLPSFVKNNTNNNYYFRLNKSKQLNADYARQQIKNVDVACNDINKIIEPKKLAPNSFVLLYLTENAAGKILYDIANPSLTSLFKKRCEVESHLNSVIRLIENRIKVKDY